MNRPALIVLLILALLPGCKKSHAPEASKAAPAQAQGQRLKIGLVYDMGNKLDKSFNEAAYLGLTRAAQELQVEIQEIEPARDVDREEGVRTLASEGYGLIIGVGFAFADIMKTLSSEYPNTRFACLDAQVDGCFNVLSLCFKEEQGSYLVGILAAKKSQTRKVGFVGGMDIPLIHKFEAGYRAGVLSVDPSIQILSDYAGVTLTAFNDPFKGKELALSQYDRGVDVVYQAAGATGLGVIEAAKEKKLFVIGTDANQNYMAPGQVLTSMVKRGDVAVYDTIQSVAQGTFIGGVKAFDLSNQGVDYAVDEHNKVLLTQEMIDAVEGARKKIIAGEIMVPTE